MLVLAGPIPRDRTLFFTLLLFPLHVDAPSRPTPPDAGDARGGPYYSLSSDREGVPFGYSFDRGLDAPTT